MNYPKLENVNSPFGAPMGRRAYLPSDPNQPLKLSLRQLRWVDGDYDEGGAYWGGPGPGRAWSAIYRAVGYDSEGLLTELFTRAASRDAAKSAVREHLPNARFYR